jgi:hypothetical protein
MHIILTPFMSTIMYKHMGILFRHDMDTKYVMHTFGAYKQNNLKNENCSNNVIIMVLMNNVLFSPYKSKVIRWV